MSDPRCSPGTTEPMNVTEPIRCGLARAEAGYESGLELEDIAALLDAYDRLGVAQPQPNTGTKESVLDALDEFARTKSAAGGYAVDNQVIDRFLGEAREHLAGATVQGSPDRGICEALALRLRDAAQTAQNDDLSKPQTEKRERHIIRVEAVLDAAEYLEECAVPPAPVHDHIGKYAADYSPVTPEEIAKDDPGLVEIYANSRPVQAVAGECVCQNQHRRGYCTEPGCPYAMSSIEGK